MPKESPVIVQFDADENYLTVADLICFNIGLDIAANASTIDAAKKIITRIENKELKPDIAIISSVIQNSFNEGEKLAKKLREVVPGIKIIAYTEIDDEKFGDELAIKSGTNTEVTLISALNKLTKKNFKASNVISS